MIRRLLAIGLGATTLALGATTSLVQVGNFEVAAELDRLSNETEWNARRCSGLVCELERFEFDLEAEQTRAVPAISMASTARRL